MTRVIAGLFDNRRDAERTVEHLVQELAVDPAAVEAYGATTPAEAAAPALARALPAEEEATFREGLRRSVVVVAHVEAGLADRTMDIFGEYGAADLDARCAEWRGAGWTQEPGQTGYTGHDADIGYATYGGVAVTGHIPRHHHDCTPAGLLGRPEMAPMRRVPNRYRSRVRSYMQKAWRGAARCAVTAGRRRRCSIRTRYAERPGFRVSFSSLPERPPCGWLRPSKWRSPQEQKAGSVAASPVERQSPQS